MEADPVLSITTSSTRGGWTDNTTSAMLSSIFLSISTTTPASRYASSVKPACSPASASTNTSKPDATSLAAISDTRATRRSPSCVSAITTIFTELLLLSLTKPVCDPHPLTPTPSYTNTAIRQHCMHQHCHAERSEASLPMPICDPHLP